VSTQESPARPAYPLTRAHLVEDLQRLGVTPGMVLLVHSAMGQVGEVLGGALTVIDALIEVLGPEGTLMMPTHTANTDPARWQNPPVAEERWEEIRRALPPYDPARSPTRHMGMVPELFRTLPGVARSGHPVGSFAATGPRASALLAPHGLDDFFGEDSPIGRLYEAAGHVLLLGVDHDRNTSLHLAEHRATWRGKERVVEGASVLVDGEAQWMNYEMVLYDSDDFSVLGANFEVGVGCQVGRVGGAQAKLMAQRDLVDFGVEWMSTRRGAVDSAQVPGQQMKVEQVGTLSRGNLYGIPEGAPRPDEALEILAADLAGRARVERIVSRGHVTPDGEWYDQEKPEWVALLQGEAMLLFAEPEETMELVAGDWVYIPARRRHRVISTTAAPPCVWVAVHGV